MSTFTLDFEYIIEISQAKFNKLFELKIRNVETSELRANLEIYNYKILAKFKIFNAELKSGSIENT